MKAISQNHLRAVEKELGVIQLPPQYSILEEDLADGLSRVYLDSQVLVRPEGENFLVAAQLVLNHQSEVIEKELVIRGEGEESFDFKLLERDEIPADFKEIYNLVVDANPSLNKLKQLGELDKVWDQFKVELVVQETGFRFILRNSFYLAEVIDVYFPKIGTEVTINKNLL